MTANIPSKYDKSLAVIVLVLAAVIIAGATFAGVRFLRQQPLEISPPVSAGNACQVYVDGAVSSPGYYSLEPGGGVEGLVRAAGGAVSNETHLQLHVGKAGENPGPQKVNINTAPAWLLEAVRSPGE